MVINGIDTIDVTKLLPGSTVILQRVTKEIINDMFEYSKSIGCKLIYLHYGKFYIKDERYKNRMAIINELLE